MSLREEIREAYLASGPVGDNLEALFNKKIEQNNIKWFCTLILFCIVFTGIVINKEDKCEYRHTQDMIQKKALMEKTIEWRDSIEGGDITKPFNRFRGK